VKAVFNQVAQQQRVCRAPLGIAHDYSDSVGAMKYAALASYVCMAIKRAR
jgi:hypothetical protein